VVRPAVRVVRPAVRVVRPAEVRLTLLVWSQLRA
jgi:hypothetical protein